MRDRNRYLKLRGERYFYYRRVPKKLAQIDRRGTIRVALNTANPSIARERRDQLEKADDLYWSSLAAGDTDASLSRYQAAVERALSKGVPYLPSPELASQSTIEELLKRLDIVKNTTDIPTAKAVLGGPERPKTKLSKAFQIYIKEIAASQIAGKSEAQRNIWKKSKNRAIKNFKKVVGDLPLEDITRDHARKFYNWWLERIVPPKGSNTAPLSPFSGNRDIGNMRMLYAEYFKYIGEETRENPFRNMSFAKMHRSERASFPTEWIKDKILKLGALDHLNIDARLIVYILIETGARPSEICNLMPEHIKLASPVPHITIRSSATREIKTKSSRREIPLVGVALAAMKKAPDGFPRYRDRETALSATLNKAFRSVNLFPSEKHYIYSLRHSFEKRMTEAGLDYGLRCLLMGHSTNRPAYGDGGSMEYRRNELKKIELPFDPTIFDIQ